MSFTPTEDMRRFNRLVYETDAVYHEIALRFGMSDSTLRLLYLLHENDGKCLLRELCRCSGLSKQTVHSALQSLESKEILTILSESRKNKTILLTETGRNLCDKTVGKLIETENRALASVPKEMLAAYFFVSEHYLNTLGKERFISEENL